MFNFKKKIKEHNETIENPNSALVSSNGFGITVIDGKGNKTKYNITSYMPIGQTGWLECWLQNNRMILISSQGSVLEFDSRWTNIVEKAKKEQQEKANKTI
jgi:hypothetical protein